MEKRQKVSIWYVLLGIWIVLILQNYITTMFAIKTIPYSSGSKNPHYPRGIAALGYTMQTPTEDRFLMNKPELLNRITTLLGERAAEEIVFEDLHRGA